MPTLKITKHHKTHQNESRNSDRLRHAESIELPYPRHENHSNRNTYDDSQIFKNHHYPRDPLPLYSPEFDRIREDKEMKRKSRSLSNDTRHQDQDDLNYHRVIISEVIANNDEAVQVVEEELREAQSSPRECKDCCLKREYPVSSELDDVEHQANLFFKILLLRSFQMLVGFGFTFYVQVTWGSNAIVKKPPLVQFTYDFPWIIYITGALYGLLHFLIRCSQVGRNRCCSFIIFILKTFAIVIAFYIPGVRWQLVSASAVTLALGVNYILIGLIPQIKQDLYVSTCGCFIQCFSAVDNLIFGIGFWFILAGVLANNSTYVSFVYVQEDVFSQLFLHGLPTFVVTECVSAKDLWDINKIVRGRRFPLDRKSWIQAVASL